MELAHTSMASELNKGGSMAMTATLSEGNTVTSFRSPVPKQKRSTYDKEMGNIEKDRLCQQLKKDVRGNAKQFWEALKAAAQSVYDSTDAAFMAFASPSDCMMSLEQFQELGEYLGFALSYNCAKSLFEQKLRDWESYAFTLEDFQDACIVAQLDRMRARLKSHRQNMLACAFHIDSFIRHLSLYSGEVQRRRAVGRFQQKITTKFCVELWSALQQWAERRADPLISCETFLKLADQIESFQAYEMEFLGNIFERVDRARRGEVVMFDLTVTMLLMATASSRMDKAKWLFTVFDTDGDGCLSSEQVLKMYCSLVIHAAIARGDQPSYDADLLLGDELSLSKARRIYDYTISHPSDALDDDLCTFEEWWCIIGTNMSMLEELMPGTYGITWVLRPRGGRRPEPKVEKKASKRRTQEMQRERSMAGDPQRNYQDDLSAATSHWLKRKEHKGTMRGGHSRRAVQEGAERFRVHAAIRFRHAVRGEWDAIAALQSGPPASAEHGAVQLPSLDEQEKMRRGALWADEVGSFGRRQRRGHWHENHRETLTDWSRPTLSLSKIEENEQPASSLRQTRSLPELRSSTRSDELESLFPSAPLNFEEVLSMTKAKVADTTSQDRGAIERLRMETQRFGEAAIQRFRSVATVRAAGIEAHDDYMQVSSDSKEWCELCRSRHSSSCTF